MNNEKMPGNEPKTEIVEPLPAPEAPDIGVNKQQLDLLVETGAHLQLKQDAFAAGHAIEFAIPMNLTDFLELKRFIRDEARFQALVDKRAAQIKLEKTKATEATQTKGVLARIRAAIFGTKK